MKAIIHAEMPKYQIAIPESEIRRQEVAAAKVVGEEQAQIKIDTQEEVKNDPHEEVKYEGDLVKTYVGGKKLGQSGPITNFFQQTGKVLEQQEKSRAILVPKVSVLVADKVEAIQRRQSNDLMSSQTISEALAGLPIE